MSLVVICGCCSCPVAGGDRHDNRGLHCSFSNLGDSMGRSYDCMTYLSLQFDLSLFMMLQPGLPVVLWKKNQLLHLHSAVVSYVVICLL